MYTITIHGTNLCIPQGYSYKTICFIIIPALVPTKSSIQWVPGALSLGLKWPWREADRSPPSSAEVKECVELYYHFPIRLYGVVISYEKHGDKFAIYLFLCPFGTGGSFPVAIPPSTGTNWLTDWLTEWMNDWSGLPTSVNVDPLP